MTVRYEDLVENTTAILREVCEFLDLHFVPEMLVAHSDELERNTLLQREPWKQPLAGDKRYCDRPVWRERITPGIAWYIEQETHSGMLDYGYSPVVSLSWWEKVKTRGRIWSLPRRNSDELERCIALTFRYLQSGSVAQAGPLAVQTVFGDWRWFRNGQIRRTLLNYLLSERLSSCRNRTV